MQIFPSQFDDWVKYNKFGSGPVLLYGSDNGMISIMTNSVIKSLIPLPDEFSSAIIRYDYKAIKEDISLLCDEWNTLPLLTSKKIILIESCTESINEDLKNLLTRNQQNDFVTVILVAGEIRKNSALITILSKLKNAVLIPCYKPDIYTVRDFIASWLKNNKMKYDNGVPMAMAELMPLDHLAIRNELEKLKLYMDSSSTISIADIYDIFTDDSKLSLDELCYAFCARNKKEIIAQLNKKHELHGVPLCMLILRSLQTYLLRLIKIRENLDIGKSIEHILTELKPPIFFKHKDSITRLAQKLNRKQLYALFKYIIKLESEVKLCQINAEDSMNYSFLFLKKN